MKKKLLYIAGALLGVGVLLTLVLPFLINANRFRPTIETQLGSSLRRKVQIGDLSLSLLSRGFSAHEIRIADDPNFSQTPFLRAKSLDVGIELMPLLLSRSVRVTSLTLNEPEVALLRSSSGKWNFSSLGSEQNGEQKGREQKTAAPSSRQQEFSVQKLRIVNGRVTVGSSPVRGEPSTYEGVNLTARNISYTAEIPFTFEARTPGGGAAKMEGTAGPINRDNAAETPLSAAIEVRHLDLASTGFVDPSSGLGGLLDYQGTLKSDGRTAHSAGTVKADKLRLVHSGTGATQAVSVEYVTDYELGRQAGVLSRGDIHTGKSTAHLSGNYDVHGESTLVHLKLNGSGLPVSDVEGLLPAVGVILPSGTSLQGGTMDANFSIDGPVNRMVMNGALNLSHTRLAGFDLASKMSVLPALTGARGGSETVVQTLSSNLRIAQEGIRADNLKLIIPAIGSMTGQGTIGANNVLNFHMLAKLADPGQGSALGQMTSGIPILGQSTKGTIPFMIQGTTSSPVFVPDVAGAVSSGLASSLQQQHQQSGRQGLDEILGGILGKKK